MLSCANCRYFWNGYKGSVCGVHYKTIQKFNPYSGEMESWNSGNFYAEFMRSAEGECGPDRKLFKPSRFSIIYPYFKWFLIIGFITIIILYALRLR